MPRIRVLLTGDRTKGQVDLRSLLAGAGDIDVVAQPGAASEVSPIARALGVQVVVIDAGHQPLAVLNTIRHILSECPNCRVLIVTQCEDRDAVLKVIQAGASGYLVNNGAAMDLTEGVRAVSAGGMVLHPMAARIVIEAYLGCESTRPDHYECLTEREREILILVAEGYTNQQIAELLTISPKTVDTHRTHLMTKLDLHSGREVVKYALRRRLIDL